MSFVDSIKTVLSKYADFSGRARRSEFWWWFLAVVILNIIGNFVSLIGADVVTDTSDSGAFFTVNYGPGAWLVAIVWLALIIPGLAVTTRRLHDTGKSGWLQLLWLACGIGGLVVLILCIPEGTKGENQYGLDPKA